MTYLIKILTLEILASIEHAPEVTSVQRVALPVEMLMTLHHLVNSLELRSLYRVSFCSENKYLNLSMHTINKEKSFTRIKLIAARRLVISTCTCICHKRIFRYTISINISYFLGENLYTKKLREVQELRGTTGNNRTKYSFNYWRYVTEKFTIINNNYLNLNYSMYTYFVNDYLKLYCFCIVTAGLF